MKKLDFAEGLSLGVDAVTQTFAIIARKGAGKSYAAGKLVEGFAEVDGQFVIIDPVGNWYGLRLAADGKGAGLDVPVLGGLRGDIPLDPAAGKLVADTVIDTGRSFVLDVSQFSLADRKRFVTAFGEQLWLRQKALRDPQPLHVVLEEAQLFLPQQLFRGDEHMVGIWTEIVRLGRNKGIGVTLITQRPQSVSKEALTQVECLVVLQVNGVPEKKALKEWIVEKGLDTDLLNELPFLKTGVAYIWSPQWLGHFGKHAIRTKKTFDASATPKVGVKRVQAELKPIDLDALREAMAETVKKLEENDPRALKKRVVELEAQLNAARAATPAPRVEKVEVPVVLGADIAAVGRFLERVTSQSEKLRELGNDMMLAMDKIHTVMQQVAESPKMQEFVAKTQVLSRAMAANAPVRPVARVPAARPALRPVPRAAAPVSDGEARIPKGGREMLKALASRNATYETGAVLMKVQIATLAGMSPSSGTFNTYMSALRTAGYIGEQGPGFFITAAGLAFLGDDVPAVPTTTEELVAAWAEKFPGRTKEMLKELVERHPNWVSKDELGAVVGLSASSGTFNTYLSSLRSNGLVDSDRGLLKASDNLFL